MDTPEGSAQPERDALLGRPSPFAEPESTPEAAAPGAALPPPLPPPPPRPAPPIAPGTTRVLPRAGAGSLRPTLRDLGAHLAALAPAVIFLVGLLWLVAAWFTGRHLFYAVAVLFLVPPASSALRGRRENP